MRGASSAGFEALPKEILSLILDNSGLKLKELLQLSTVSRSFQSAVREVSRVEISVGCAVCAAEKPFLLRALEADVRMRRHELVKRFVFEKRVEYCQPHKWDRCSTEVAHRLAEQLRPILRTYVVLTQANLELLQYESQTDLHLEEVLASLPELTRLRNMKLTDWTTGPESPEMETCWHPILVPSLEDLHFVFMVSSSRLFERLLKGGAAIRQLTLTGGSWDGLQRQHLELDLQAVEICSITFSDGFSARICSGSQLRSLTCSAQYEEEPEVEPGALIVSCRLLCLTEARFDNLRWEQVEGVLRSSPRLTKLCLYGDRPMWEGGLPRLNEILRTVAGSTKHLRSLETESVVLKAPVPLWELDRHCPTSLVSVSISQGSSPLSFPGYLGSTADGVISQIDFLLSNSSQLQHLKLECQVVVGGTKLTEYTTVLQDLVRLQRMFPRAMLEARLPLSLA